MNLLTNIHKKCSADAMCILYGQRTEQGRGPSKGDPGERNVVGACCMREGGWRLCPKGRREATVKGSGGEKAAGWAGGWGSERPLATAMAVQEALLPPVPPSVSGEPGRVSATKWDAEVQRQAVRARRAPRNYPLTSRSTYTHYLEDGVEAQRGEEFSRVTS